MCAKNCCEHFTYVHLILVTSLLSSRVCHPNPTAPHTQLFLLSKMILAIPLN